MARVNERFTLTPQDAAYLRRVGARTALGTLCRHFGVSPHTLRRAMAEAGIPPLSELRKMVMERKRRLVARLYGTVPGIELAARLRVRPGTVRHWASDMGLPHTPRVREYNARRQRETGHRLGTLYAERSQRRLRAIRKAENLRRLSGEPLRTKLLAAVCVPVRTHRARYALVRGYGYYYCDDPFVLLYDGQTRRPPAGTTRRKPESWYTACYGIRFAPADGEAGDGQALQKPVTKREGTGRTAWTDGEE